MNLTINFVKVGGAIFLSILLLACFLTSGLFSTIFYTNGDIVFKNGNLDTSEVNLNTIVLLIMVLSLELSKIVFSLIKNLSKNQNMIVKTNFLLKLLFLLSVLASISYFLIENNNYAPATKIITALFMYIPIPLFLKKYIILFANISLSISIEYLIIFIPNFIFNLFSSKEIIELKGLGYISRILFLIKVLIDNKLNSLENKFLNQSQDIKISVQDDKKLITNYSVQNDSVQNEVNEVSDSVQNDSDHNEVNEVSDSVQNDSVQNEVNEVSDSVQNDSVQNEVNEVSNSVQNDSGHNEVNEVSDSVQNDSGHNEVNEVSDSVQNDSDHNEVVERIKKYIKANFEIGKRIKTNILCEEFNLKKRGWDKVKDSLLKDKIITTSSSYTYRCS